MARKASNAAIAADLTAPEPKAPFHGPREQNPRRKGRNGRRRGRGRKHNPKKNLGYGAKVGIAIGALVVVGGGGYMLYRRYHRGAGGLTQAEKTASSQLSPGFTGFD